MKDEINFNDPSNEGLKLSRNDLKLILDSISESIYGVDLDCNLTFCNTTFLRTLGYDNPEKVLGKNIHDLIHHHYADGSVYPGEECSINIKLKKGEDAHADNEVFWRADGTSFPVEFWAYPQYRDEKKVGNVVTFMDISERKKSKQDLYESEKRYRGLLNNLDAGVVVHAPDTSIIMSNPKASALLGLSQDQMRGKQAMDKDWKFLSENNTPLPLAQYPINQILLKRQPLKNLIGGVFRPSTNDVVWLMVNGYPVFNDNGELHEVVISFIDITERKHAEEVQKESERFLKETQTIANLGTYSLDITSGKWTSSEVFDKIYGIDDQFEKTYENWPSIIHPDWRKLMTDYFMDEVVGNKKRFDKVYKIIRINDKTERWVHGIGSLKLDESNQPVTMVGTIRDITESKQAEEELRKSEEKYRQIVETSQEGIWMIDEFNKTSFVNVRMADMLGYKRDEMIGRSLFDFMDEEGVEIATGNVERRKHGITEQHEFIFKKKNGDNVFVLLETNPIYEGGQYQGSLAMIMDITKRKKAEQQVAMLMNNTEENFLLVDKQFNIVSFNRQFMETYKLFFNKIVQQGDSIFNYAASDRIENLKKTYHKVFEGERLETELEVLLKDNTMHTFLNRYKPCYDNKGNIIGAFVTSVDITDRKKAEMELIKSQAELRHLSAHLQTIRDEEGTRIAREIHDELGQQLTGLKMDASWISKRIHNDDRVVIDKMNSMINLIDETVKTVRRIASELRPGILDDLGLIAALEWQSQEFEKRTEVKCKFESRIDEINIDKKIASGIFRIYQETLTNIARHARASRVEASFELKHNKIVLKVKDNGSGFNISEAQDKNALGMIGMKERAIMLGGDLKIISKINDGTSIILKVPYESIK